MPTYMTPVKDSLLTTPHKDPFKAWMCVCLLEFSGPVLFWKPCTPEGDRLCYFNSCLASKTKPANLKHFPSEAECGKSKEVVVVFWLHTSISNHGREFSQTSAYTQKWYVIL